MGQAERGGVSGVRDWAAEEVETAQREQGRGLSAGLGLGFRGFGFSVFSFSFLFLNKSNLIEFKQNLNSNPMHSTKQIKLMHQHECTNKFKPKIIFNCLCNKIRLNAS